MKKSPSPSPLHQEVIEDVAGIEGVKRERWLLALCCAPVLLCAVWVSWAQVDKIVRGQGRIVASGRAQVVQHLEGGIVSEILVREGEQIKVGQALMRLSSVQASSNVQQGQSRLVALRAQEARLRAEAQGESQIRFTDEVPENIRALERLAFSERSSRMGSEALALKQQISQRQSELEEANSRATGLQRELGTAKNQLSMLESLVRKGASSRFELLEAQGKFERLSTEYNDVVNTIPRLRAAIAETSARYNEAGSRFRAEARVELSSVAAEIARFDAAVGSEADRLARTEVRASANGYVNRLMINTVGGVIKPGDAVVEITPTDGPLTVEAKIRPDDRASLQTGLPARVRLGAYDYTAYGALEGKVVEVSADTLAEADGQRYYRLTIQAMPPEGALSRAILLPGMTASVDVVVGKRSIASYLLSPLLRFRTMAFTEPR